MNSRRKGKEGELEAASFLTQYGFPARRGQQFSGSPESPDVVCPTLASLHFEVKRTQRTDLYAWIAQAKHDAGGKIPVVLHRRNDSEWLVVIRAEDFLALARESDITRSPGCDTQLPPTEERNPNPTEEK